ncbi:MAG: RnfABCDGE type electron transport complex subunit D [Lachnospiraceae bacterium]|nr:RnfABCDGE type electron transport complex subunit D [Lachnospiraceae bacterium]
MECVGVERYNHGIDVYEESWEQLTRDKSFEGYMPEKVCISLCQMDGVICHPTVNIGDYVYRGQVIGKPDDERFACVHASISGYIEEIFQYQRAPGIFEPILQIRKRQEKNREWYPFSLNYDKETIQKMMYQIGIHKDTLSFGKNLIVNGFANEPYITSGYRLIIESPGKVIIGAILWAMAADSEQIYLCINEDALDAVVRLKRAVKKYGHNLGNRRPIWVVPMKRRYPKGNEHIIKSVVAGRDKSSAVVVTVAEMTALYDGIYDGEPWTKVGVTLSGKVSNPKNLWVPIGTNVKELIDYCGGMQEDAMVISGGPFGGTTIDASRHWIRRDTSGILVMDLKDIPESACVHCGMCREVCPEKLMPDQIEKEYLAGNADLEYLHADYCIRCGLCSYVCPSGRRLTEYVGQVKKGRVRKKGEEKIMKGSYIHLRSQMNGLKSLKSLEIKSQSAPHIHRRGTIQDVMRNSIYGLIPLILGVLIQNPSKAWHIVSMLSIGAITCVLTEYYWQEVHGRYSTLRDGSAVFTGILLALLFSVETPLWKVIAASIVAILLGKQCFGGIGSSLIHPVIVGKIFVQPFEVPMIEPLWYLAVLAFLWMLMSRMVPWIFPMVYLLVVGMIRQTLLESALVYIVAAYFVWSYETMVPTRLGKWMYTLILSVFTVLFEQIGMGVSGIFFAVAFSNLILPIFKNRSVKRV